VTAFLDGLDQWALQVLMMLYTLMGVQDIPREPDPHWQVVERWSEQPDGHYRLILKSNTIQKECLEGRAKYIVFPQSYMAKQEVYADDVRVYTNEMDEKWHLRSILDRPVISCELFLKHVEIKFVTTVNMKYFSSTNRYPSISFLIPNDYYLYDLNYIMAAVVSIVVTFLGGTVLFVMGKRDLKLIGMGFSIFFLMIAHVPGYFIKADLATAHLTLMVSSIALSYFYISRKISIVSRKEIGFFVLGWCLLGILLSINHRNTNHVIMMGTSLFTTTFGILYAIIAKKIQFKDRLILILVLSAANVDMYRSQILREGYLNLSILVVAVIIFEIFSLMNHAYNTKIKSQKIEQNFLVERAFKIKTEEFNEILSSTIHNMKAPLTSLNFHIKNNTVNLENLKYLSERFSSILDHELATNKADEYEAVSDLMQSIEVVCVEMRPLFEDIKIDIEILDQASLVFFNTKKIKNAISEILLNSLKAAQKNNLKPIVKVNLTEDSNYFNVNIVDNSGGIDSKLIHYLGNRGFSTAGTGLGLWFIKKNILDSGGKIKFSTDNRGLSVSLNLLKKN
jgi:signal transduction histidine kinase